MLQRARLALRWHLPGIHKADYDNTKDNLWTSAAHDAIAWPQQQHNTKAAVRAQSSSCVESPSGAV